MAKATASANTRAGGGAGAQSDHVYRVIQVVGSSKESLSDAIETGIARAGKTLRNMRWFEVERISGHVDNGKVSHYQATMTIGFTMEEPE
jgi:flavin-binding protein dodecin